MKPVITIPLIDKIKTLANTKKTELFKKSGWKLNHKLTDGDVRLILETYLEVKNESITRS